METGRVLIVDDNVNVRRRVREFLTSAPDIEVVGEAGDGQQALTKAAALEPDIVLMDVRMRGGNGLEATRRLREELPKVCVIMLSCLDVQEYKDMAMAEGASAYVVKRAWADDLLPAIRAILQERNTLQDAQSGRPGAEMK
jgi:DNA-binding NarL/FixJ family response regulator